MRMNETFYYNQRNSYNSEFLFDIYYFCFLDQRKSKNYRDKVRNLFQDLYENLNTIKTGNKNYKNKMLAKTSKLLEIQKDIANDEGKKKPLF